MKMISLFLLLNFFGIFSIQGAEVDNFTYRNLPLPDGIRVLNKKTNQFLVEAIDKANEKGPGCNDNWNKSKKRLYKTLRKYFQNHWVGKFNKWILETKNIHKVYIPFKKSVFGVFNARDSFAMRVMGPVIRAFGDDQLVPYLKVGGVLVGTDKFEHFMGTGFRYFRSYFLKGKSLEDTADIGWGDELGLLGAKSNGVMSYGDLAAEFNGMFFWAHMLREFDGRKDLSRPNDLVSEMYQSQGPYIVCKNNTWEKNPFKKIDWASYMDDAMDEAVNCSRFRTKRMADKIERKIKSMGFSCPVSKRKFKALEKKYGPYKKYILNFDGHTGIMNLERPF